MKKMMRNKVNEKIHKLDPKSCKILCSLTNYLLFLIIDIVILILKFTIITI